MTFLSSEDARDGGSGLKKDRYLWVALGRRSWPLGLSTQNFDILIFGYKRAKESLFVLHSTSRSVR